MTDPAEQCVLAIVAADPWAMDMLRLVRRLNLPDWFIGAGFLRGLVWDQLCGFATSTPPNDIDIVYFDTGNTSRIPEEAAESRLSAWCPGQIWSVRNMARMHIKNRDAPYRDTADGIGHWLETPTAVGVSLTMDGGLRLAAPHGLDDLLAGQVRPTPSGRRKIEEYRNRTSAKDWPARWPKVTVETE